MTDHSDIEFEPVPKSVRVRPAPVDRATQKDRENDGDDGPGSGSMSWATKSVDAVLRNNPRLKIDVPHAADATEAQRDARDGPIKELLLNVISRTRPASNDITATFYHEDLDQRILVALELQEVIDLMTLTTQVREEGLPNGIGGHFPRQDMTGFIMALAGTGSPEKGQLFDRLAAMVRDQYQPSQLLTWYHDDVRFGARDPIRILPLIELPQVEIGRAFPGLLHSTAYRAWIHNYRGSLDDDTDSWM